MKCANIMLKKLSMSKKKIDENNNCTHAMH